MSKKKYGPLKDFLILDMTRVLAGPYASMVLSDLGARIIKIEPPKGDDARKFGPIINNTSSYFASLNRGKESIVLNLKVEEDRSIFNQLLEQADILIENYRPGTMKKLGYGWNILSKKYPKLIYASCSGFGQTGPWSSKPAYDMIVQGLGGIMSLTGNEGEEPIRVGTSIGDIVAGIFTVIGIQAAIIDRKTTKKGQLVDVSMLDCQLAILENAISRFFSTGRSPKKSGSRHPSIAPFECYKSKNHYILIAAGNDQLFHNLCIAIKAKELIKDKKYRTNLLRMKNVNSLKKDLEAVLINKTTNFWIKQLEKYGVPVGPLNNIKEAVKSEQIITRNMIVGIKGKKYKNMKIAGNPIKLSKFKDPSHREAVPELNENKSSILKEFNIIVKK